MNKFIKQSVDSGYDPIVLEPHIKLNKAIVGVDDGRLIYHVDLLLNCFAEDMGHTSALEWFYCNTIETTKLEHGPLFFDENERNYLTLPSKPVKLEVYTNFMEDK